MNYEDYQALACDAIAEAERANLLPDYKERRRYAIFQAAAVIYAGYLTGGARHQDLNYKGCVLDAMGLMAEVQNIESGEEQ